MYPPRLILEHEVLNGKLTNVLLLHSTDRWYLGDFIRHAGWLTSLAALHPQQLALATHREYLPLFETDSRVQSLLDVSVIDDAILGTFDLVVVPSSFPPESYNPAIARALYYSDRGWIYVRYGSTVASGKKSELNYFITALHSYGQTALPAAKSLLLDFPEAAIEQTAKALTDVFGNANPVIVYNPTASNPFTRQTDIKKEVENVLNPEEHTSLIRAVHSMLPQYNILIGSAFRDGDVQNQRMIETIKESFADDEAIKSIFSLGVPGITSLRGFSILLKTPLVAASLGTSTGTNTHLAVLTDTASYSIERAADADMIANWQDPEAFQMGSFRWRNPSPLVGAYNLDWQTRTLQDYDHIARGFYYHLMVQTGEYAELFDGNLTDVRRNAAEFLRQLDGADPADMLRSLSRFADCLQPGVPPFYKDFSDETAYLQLQPGCQSIKTLEDVPKLPSNIQLEYAGLIRNLVKDSMLYKLAYRVSPPVDGPPAVTEADRLYRKIRANVPLRKRELRMLGFTDGTGIQDFLYQQTKDYFSQLAASPEAEGIRDGWQHVVHIEPDVVIKEIATNTASEFLTDDFTAEGITSSLKMAGGLVPASGPLIGRSFVSKRINVFVEPASETMSKMFGRDEICRATLAVGWIDEQLDNYTRLIKRGVFNLGIKLRDTGIDDEGVLLMADFSSCRPIRGQFFVFADNLRTDIFHIGINDLITNGQFLAEFANGGQLLDHYARCLEELIGIDLRPYFADWRWGDHGRTSITPLADKLRLFIRTHANTEKPLPVMPSVNTEAETRIYKLLQDRISRDGAPRTAQTHTISTGMKPI